MKLSTDKDWNYQEFKTNLSDVEKYQRENEWVGIVRKYIPKGELSYLELGCSPGFCSAVTAQNTKWIISGVDFSNSESTFLKTLSLIGKEAKYYQSDIFKFKTLEKFDIVASYGLIEHFSGSDFEEILKIHDDHLKPSGYLILEVPNFTGFQYVWHYIFDKPNLLIHNTDIMSPQILASFYQRLGYHISYCDYIGVLKVWGVSRFDKLPLLRPLAKIIGLSINRFSALLAKCGLKINGKYASPALLLIAKKKA